MEKINNDFIVKQYQSGVESYAAFTRDVGLWESEKYVFEKYLKKKDIILDLGCGTGRTTFPLFKLGFESIIGLDLTLEMVEKARELNDHFETNIQFEIGDATDLRFNDESFDAVIFSFNGLMSIPSAANRRKAVREIKRILREHGVFIFTTHDRNMEKDYFNFWKQEAEVWKAGGQKQGLYEFGDLITFSKNESEKIFIHIPDQEEVNSLLSNAGFSLVETFYRNEKFDESNAVKSKSGECRFWVFEKNEN